MANTELKEWDIIMEGGIGAGGVYPKAILELSEYYRFRSIGGTSAGAIAAVITASAEYNRAGDGFKVIAELPTEIRSKLETLFQASPNVRALFNAAKFGCLEKRWGKALGWLLSGYWLSLLVGILPFPAPARLPLAVAARMSLSFPILFAAIPLYRLDYPHKGTDGKPMIQRMLFSVGGL